ncbi:MAG: hypothetical protein ABUJ98_06845 [Hyphomicrobium sp.]
MRIRLKRTTFIRTKTRVSLAPPSTVRADVDIDPWIIGAGVGYRFNLADLLGGRSAPSLK